MTDEKATRKLAEMYDNMGSYSAVASALGVQRWDVHKAMVYGVKGPKIKRALAIYCGEHATWSSTRQRVYADMGTEKRMVGLKVMLSALGYGSASQLLQDVADGRAVVHRVGRVDGTSAR